MIIPKLIGAKRLEERDFVENVVFSLPKRMAAKLALAGGTCALPEGIYKATQVERNERVATQVWVVPYQNVFRKDPFPLVFEARSKHLLVPGGRLLIPYFYPVAFSVKEVDLVNRNRNHCLFCNRSLNIISVNVKFCSVCEGALNED